MRSHRIALTFAAVMAAFAAPRPMPPPRSSSGTRWKALGDRVNGLVDEFNKKNPEYQVKAVQGHYGESMNRASPRSAPATRPTSSRFEVGTATMMYARAPSSGAADVRRSRQPDRSQRNSSAPWRLLLVGRRQAGVDAVQQLHRGVLLQQGRLQEGRPGRRQTAQDLGRAGRRRPKLKAAGQNAATPPRGRPGSSWKRSRPGNVPYATRTTASAAWTPALP